MIKRVVRNVLISLGIFILLWLFLGVRVDESTNSRQLFFKYPPSFQFHFCQTTDRTTEHSDNQPKEND